MHSISVLRIDLTRRDAPSAPVKELQHDYAVRWLNNDKRLTAALCAQSPYIICFDYHVPDAPGLQPLQHTRAHWPHIPAPMPTQKHSERVAIWSLRSRVWDYPVKPFSTEELHTKLDILAGMSRSSDIQHVRRNPMPAPACGDQQRTRDTPCRTGPASHYIEKHLDGKPACCPPSAEGAS